MRRREFITTLGSAVATTAWPLAARAQQPDQMRRIGVLLAVAESDVDVSKGIGIFQQTLQDLGWKVGHNTLIDYRWGNADPERIQALAKELVDLNPGVLVGHSTPSAKGLLKYTRSTPSFSSRLLTHWVKAWSQASRVQAEISPVSRYSSFHSAANGSKRSN